MLKRMLTPAKLNKPLHIVFFFINMFCGGIGTCITACLVKPIEPAHIITGLLQCVTCYCWIGYPWAMAWGTCFWLKGKDDLTADIELRKGGGNSV